MIVHADNFNIYGNNQNLMLNGIYAQVQAFLGNDPDGISTAKVMTNQQTNANNTSELLRYAFQSGEQNVVGLCFRQWLTNLPLNNGQANLYSLQDIGNTEILSYWVTATGQIAVRVYMNNGNNFAYYYSPIPVLTANGWYHIEAKFSKTGNTTADVEIRIEGLAVLQLAGIAIENRKPAQFRWFQNNAGISFGAFMKDLVIWDGTGAQNNNFLGSVLVTNLVPQSDVSLNWSLQGGATGYEILDNIPPNDGAFIYAPYNPAPAGPYKCTLSDLPIDSTSVKALITFVRAAKADGGDGSLQNGVISAGVTGLGANRPITVAQTYWRDLFELDPATGAAWLPAAVNAATLQINRTA